MAQQEQFWIRRISESSSDLMRQLVDRSPAARYMKADWGVASAR
jgi:hypothetical protein